MKTIKWTINILVALCIICLVGCDTPARDPSISSSMSSSVRVDISSPTSGSGLGNNIPMLLDFLSMELHPLDFDVNERWPGKPIALEHVTSVPPSEFMRGLEQMEEAEYVALLEKSNYFQVGRYILFYANESSVGSSKIVIEALDSGQLVEIFNATQPIMSLKFSVDKGVIIVNLAEQVGGDWYIGNYYTLDLETGKLTLYELPLSGDGIGYWHWIYYDCHYFVDQRQHELRASDIYLHGYPHD